MLLRMWDFFCNFAAQNRQRTCLEYSMITFRLFWMAWP